MYGHIGEKFSCKGQPNSFEKNLFQDLFVQHRSQWICLGLNPDISAAVHATRHLSHDTTQHTHFQTSSSAGLHDIWYQMLLCYLYLRTFSRVKCIKYITLNRTCSFKSFTFTNRCTYLLVLKFTLKLKFILKYSHMFRSVTITRELLLGPS